MALWQAHWQAALVAHRQATSYRAEAAAIPFLMPPCGVRPVPTSLSHIEFVTSHLRAPRPRSHSARPRLPRCDPVCASHYVPPCATRCVSPERRKRGFARSGAACRAGQPPTSLPPRMEGPSF
jgi:hypothetical protein